MSLTLFDALLTVPAQCYTVLLTPLEVDYGWKLELHKKTDNILLIATELLEPHLGGLLHKNILCIGCM